MKLGTHILFGFALTLWLLSFFTGVVSPTLLFYALLVSSLTNIFIDAAGHEGVKRSPVTHGVFGSIFVTLVVALGLMYLGFNASPWLALSVFFNCYIHYILDMMTMQGVQLLYPIHKKGLSHRLCKI